MSLSQDFGLAARWGLKMTNIGPEGLISELPPAWRRACYAALLAVSMTASYFLFVQAPIADAKDAIKANRTDITTLQQDVASMKGDISTVKTSQGRSDQKLEDLKDSVATMNNKLDRLLMRGQHASQFP